METHHGLHQQRAALKRDMEAETGGKNDDIRVDQTNNRPRRRLADQDFDRPQRGHERLPGNIQFLSLVI